jgi:hypothetical protein
MIHGHIIPYLDIGHIQYHAECAQRKQQHGHTVTDCIIVLSSCTIWISYFNRPLSIRSCKSWFDFNAIYAEVSDVSVREYLSCAKISQCHCYSVFEVFSYNTKG